MPYQSFPNTPGDSDSPAKLDALQLGDLSGKSFLDVGCNEGFFCQEAWRRGARRVVGIDSNPEVVTRARQKDPDTEYRVMDWTDLPSLEESFDVILLLSALHYAAEPEKVLRSILDLLNPDGLFILECGVAPASIEPIDVDRPRWVEVVRLDGGVVRHPTASMVKKVLEGPLRRAAVREVGHSVDQLGDPLERRVFHVRPLKPTVLLISGPSGSGKSTLTRDLKGNRSASLDELILDMSLWCRDESLLQLRYSQPFKVDQVPQIVDLMVREGVEESFAEQIVPAMFRFSPDQEPGSLVIEGYALSQGRFRDALTDVLQEHGCYVWHVEPAPGGSPRDPRA